MNLGIPSGASSNKDTPARQSYDIISESFGEGYNGMLLLVAESPIDEETKALVEYLRTNDSLLANTNLKVGIAGLTAINIDISKKLSEVFPIYIGIIVVLSLVILLIVFRSVIILIKCFLSRLCASLIFTDKKEIMLLLMDIPLQAKLLW